MLLTVLGLSLSLQANANTTIVDILVAQQNEVIAEQVRTQGIDWKVGDQANYKIDMGFIKGSMIMKVREIIEEGIWINQDADLGFAGKQKIEQLIDKNTGEVKKMIVNGKEQQPPKQNMEIIEVKEDRITVPAGTFDCIHARLKDKDKNEEMNAWINPQQVPLSGLLKAIQPSQFGNVTIELSSFKKN